MVGGIDVEELVYRCIGHVDIGMYVHQWGRWGVGCCRLLGGEGFSGLLLLLLLLLRLCLILHCIGRRRRRRWTYRVLHRRDTVCHFFLFQSILSSNCDFQRLMSRTASGPSGPWR